MTTRTVNQLRPYQAKAIEHMLSHPQGGLFLDMGLGKTASALTAIQEFKRFGVGATLVVGPIRVIETVWRQEAAVWEHTKDLSFSMIRGNATQRTEALRAKADIYLINPEHLVWLFDTIGEEQPFPFEVLMIDESSMFKDIGTKRFKALRHQVKKFQRRYILTGTPTPNKLLELWPQLFLIDEGQRLGTSFTRFKARYFAPVDRWGYKVEPREGARERVYESIADIVLRMDAKDYLDLPEVIFNRVETPLDKDTMRIYREVEDQAFSSLDSMTRITAMNVMGSLIKARQVANGVVYTEFGDGKSEAVTKTKVLHKEKLNAAREIVDETGSPVIIVYNFKHELALLQEEFKDMNPVTLVDEKDASKVVADWNAGKIQVLFLHPQSGGHGLNLQEGGHTMIWFGLTFSYEQYAQTIARINRQGQTKPVVVHTLIAPGTVDVLLEKVLESKKAEQDDLFAYLKNYRKRGKL